MGKHLFKSLVLFASTLSSLAAQAEFISPRTLQAALAAGAPESAVREASDYLESHASQFPNKKFLTLIDFTRHSGQKRMFILDLVNEKVDALLVAHGKNSDKDNDGYATEFSNVSESLTSSLGFFKVAERFSGDHGTSLRMDGLESRNDKARARGIIIHAADYVRPDLEKMGRSWGCPAVETKWMATLANRLEQGSLLYAYIQDIHERSL